MRQLQELQWPLTLGDAPQFDRMGRRQVAVPGAMLAKLLGGCGRGKQQTQLFSSCGCAQLEARFDAGGRGD